MKKLVGLNKKNFEKVTKIGLETNESLKKLKS